MADFRSFAGSFPTRTSPGIATISGVGFQPRVVILIAAGNDSAGAWHGVGTPAAQTGLSVQWFAQPTIFLPGTGAVVSEAATAVALGGGAALVAHGLDATGLNIRTAGTATVDDGAVIVDARLGSMEPDGFSLDYLTADPVARIVHFLALGGDALRVASVGWSLPPPEAGASVEVNVGGVGFRPDAVLSLWGSNDLIAYGEQTSRVALGLGAFDGDGNEWALSYFRPFTPGTDVTASIKSITPARALYSQTGAVDATFVAMTEDGFRLLVNPAAIAVPRMPTRILSLALGGIRARVGRISKPSASLNQVTTGIGFAPTSLLLATVGEPDGTTPGIRASIGLGCESPFGPDSPQGCVSRIDADDFGPGGAEALKRTDVDRILVGPDNAETTAAELGAFGDDGFALDWTTDASESYPVGFLALGARPIVTGPNRRASLNRFEAEFGGIFGGWTDVSGDVLLDDPGFEVRYGIGGTGPADLVASTGTLKFSLNNSESNSAGRVGYYSPGHPNCRPGFALGVRVRYSYIIPGSDGVIVDPDNADRFGKFVGRVLEIAPEPGRYRDRKTACLAADWFNEAAITRYTAPTQVAKRTDEVLATIVALVPRQPDAVAFDVADSTFPYSLDNGLVERSTVLTEIQRLALSEYGHVYMRGGLNFWGRLVFEKRTARLTPTPAATFDGTMQALDTGNTTAKIRNRAKVTAHPRRIDEANTTVLFNRPPIASAPAIVPAETVRISGRYVDPNNPNARIGGTDMVPPVATTDYAMNSLANGTGTNLTANFAVVATFGANSVDFAITNNGGTPGFVTFLRVRGRGLYDYDPIEVEEEDAESIALIGESGVALDLPYQSDYSVATALAEFLVASWSSRGGVAETSIKFIPRTFDELSEAMALEPGMAIVVREELSVVDDVYFIQNVTVQGTGDRTAFGFELQRALVRDYWTLGVAGRSELEATTVLAPL